MCTANQIAESLKIRATDAVASATELCVRGAIKITPVSIGKDVAGSTKYSAIKKAFVDNSEFCVCKKIICITSDTVSSDFGYWDTCCICDKHLKDGFHYYNHYDGEDHDDIEF